MAKDPVCGMNVEESSAKYTLEYQGKTYYFCAAGCKGAFAENPGKYLDASHKPSMLAALGDHIRGMFVPRRK